MWRFIEDSTKLSILTCCKTEVLRPTCLGYFMKIYVETQGAGIGTPMGHWNWVGTEIYYGSRPLSN